MPLRCSIQMVIDVLHSKVGVPLNSPGIETASWEELGVESLALTEVCTTLENTIGIVIPSEEAFARTTVQEFVLFVNSLQA